MQVQLEKNLLNSLFVFCKLIKNMSPFVLVVFISTRQKMQLEAPKSSSVSHIPLSSLTGEGKEGEERGSDDVSISARVVVCGCGYEHCQLAAASTSWRLWILQIGHLLIRDVAGDFSDPLYLPAAFFDGKMCKQAWILDRDNT